MFQDAKKAVLPRGIWILGFVSMLMDISSEMIHSLLPLFLVGPLGASDLALDSSTTAPAKFQPPPSGTWTF